MDIFTEGHYKRNRILMISVGIWPESSIFSKIFARTFALVILFSMLLPQYAFLKQPERNISDFVSVIVNEMAIILVCMELCYVASNMKKAMFEMDEPAKMAGFLIFAVGQITHLLFLSIPGQELYDHSSRVFNTIYSTNWIKLSTEHQKMILIMLMRSMNPSYITAGNFYRMNVENFKNYAFLNQPDKHLNDLISCLIIQLVILTVVLKICYIALNMRKVHTQRLAKRILLAELIESSFTMMFAFVVLINMILISMTAFETVLKVDDPGETVRFVLFIIGQIAHLFCTSLPGQELLDHSNRVFTDIYNSNWFDIAGGEQRMLLFMLMRSMKPSYMTAGKFYTLHIENFKNVLRTSMSYFTVFLSVR
nr:PREDICTED: uncharacterized protein LOC105270482 [Fopius arisanus]